MMTKPADHSGEAVEECPSPAFSMLPATAEPRLSPEFASRGPHRPSEKGKIIYCPGCNDLFNEDRLRCPRCGMPPADSPVWVADTQVLGADGDSTRDSAVDSPRMTDVLLDNHLLDGQCLDIYECDSVLGRGGMGIVYLARNTSLHRMCAIKVLAPRKQKGGYDYLSRFQLEGRAAAALVHPNVITVHAIGRCGERHFIEMEYVPGNSLQAEIDQQPAGLGPIRSTTLAVGIADALAAAHRLSIVHRDVKPDNVILTPSGAPKLGDFGLARNLMSEDPGTSRLAGTPRYMAPELYDGTSAGPATDVFALGVCYYQMLTGKFPFDGDSFHSLQAACQSGDYMSVRRCNPDIPLDIAECVGLMLSPSADQRPRDGAAAAQLLKAVLGASRDLDTLVQDAFTEVPGISWRSERSRVQLTMRIPGGRTQQVFLENSEHSAGDRLLLIYSLCCEARPDFFEEALRLNSEVPHGGISIRDVDGTPYFVMVDTYPRATVSAEDIRRSVLELGMRADGIEHRLTGGDVH